MPIYGYGIIGAPYKLDKIPVEDLKKLYKIYIEATRTFEYKNDKVFVSSIKSSYKANIVADYDIHRAGIASAAYTVKLEKLITKCNQLIKSSDKEKYIFDIMGNWEVGKIVILIKNKDYEDPKVKVYDSEEKTKKKKWYDKNKSWWD